MSDKKIIEARKLKGFRDYSPELSSIRLNIMRTIWKNAELFGFEAIDTPIIEYSETLLGSGGAETDKEVYRFLDNGDRDVSLRFDLTVPFARYVAENQGTMVFPFKRVQIGDVFRGEKPQKGRYRQFCQGDFDIIGADTIASDVEVVSFLGHTLDSLLDTPFTVYLSHRAILSGLIYTYFPKLSSENEVKFLIWLDKIEKIGKQKVISGISSIDNLETDKVEGLINLLLTKNNKGDSDLDLISSHITSDSVQSEIRRFKNSFELLESQSKDCDNFQVKVDLSIARGLGYYTGIVLETKIDLLPKFGSIASGGRYDQLVSRFSKRELPGVGASIGVDRLLAAIEELAPKDISAISAVQVFIAIFDEDSLACSLDLVKVLRLNDINADISLKVGKISNQFKWADKKGIPFVVAIGENERVNQKFTIKNMKENRETSGLSINDLINFVKENKLNII